MDLLCSAYSNTSEDEEDGGPGSQNPHVPPPQKRHRPELSDVPKYHHSINRQIYPPPQSEAPAVGRYVSKRERALMAANPVSSRLNESSSRALTSTAADSVSGSISNSVLPHDVLSSLRQRKSKGVYSKSKLPETMSLCLQGHTKAVNAIRWSTTHAHLLASAAMDKNVYIWNVWSKEQKRARVFDFHNAAVKDVRWSPQGQFVLTCGYDCFSRLIDVEKGVETQNFMDSQSVTAIKFHPSNANLFLSGGSEGILKLWDTRTGKEVHNYVRRLGPILDVEFMNDGTQFISSSDESRSNISENSIIIWDVSREISLSNQVYAEAYTCPSIRCHQFKPFFVAQSNGNYIAIFSTKYPFRLDKYKRYESHGVFGYPIKCDFSLDGENLVSGSSDGNMYFYDVNSSSLIKKVKGYEHACVGVAFHPVLPNVIASCSWSGAISIFE